MACVGKTQPSDETGNAVRGVVAQPANLDSDDSLLDYTGLLCCFALLENNVQ